MGICGSLCVNEELMEPLLNGVNNESYMQLCEDTDDEDETLEFSGEDFSDSEFEEFVPKTYYVVDRNKRKFFPYYIPRLYHSTKKRFKREIMDTIHEEYLVEYHDITIVEGIDDLFIREYDYGTDESTYDLSVESTDIFAINIPQVGNLYDHWDYRHKYGGKYLTENEAWHYFNKYKCYLRDTRLLSSSISFFEYMKSFDLS